MSTPKTYVNALKKENTKWPIWTEDLLSYFEKPGDGYWSGFYTSRPTFKKQIKDASALFQASSKVYGLAMIDKATTQDQIKDYKNASTSFLDLVSIMQHHDAVTGTASQYVTFDY